MSPALLRQIKQLYGQNDSLNYQSALKNVQLKLRKSHDKFLVEWGLNHQSEIKFKQIEKSAIS